MLAQVWEVRPPPAFVDKLRKTPVLHLHARGKSPSSGTNGCLSTGCPHQSHGLGASPTRAIQGLSTAFLHYGGAWAPGCRRGVPQQAAIGASDPFLALAPRTRVSLSPGEGLEAEFLPQVHGCGAGRKGWLRVAVVQVMESSGNGCQRGWQGTLNRNRGRVA
jgi:hypothetical protein